MKEGEVQVLSERIIIPELLPEEERNQQGFQQSKSHYRMKDTTELQTDSIISEVHQLLSFTDEQSGQERKMPH